MSLLCGSCTDKYQQKVIAFREMKNEKFAHPSSSPFENENLKDFKGLVYFEVKPRYKVEAKLQKSLFPSYFSLFSDSSITQVHEEVGLLFFSLEGQDLTLKAYRSSGQPKHQLFIPFKDLTNQSETYGGGRYVDAVLLNDSTVELDFNLAYNPYCAYNETFVCAAVPAANKLQVAVEAGEKRYFGDQ